MLEIHTCYSKPCHTRTYRSTVESVRGNSVFTMTHPRQRKRPIKMTCTKLCEGVHTAQGQRTTQISIGFCTHFSGFCISLGLGPRKCKLTTSRCPRMTCFTVPSNVVNMISNINSLFHNKAHTSCSLAC